MNYGLVCISEILKAQDKSLAFKKITRKRFSELESSEAGSGLKVLEERVLHNLQLTEKIIRHCAKNSISHYRLSSSLFPLITDPTLKLQLQKLSNYKDIRNQCEVIGNVAEDLSVSLSIHPDQFNVLASEKHDHDESDDHENMPCQSPHVSVLLFATDIKSNVSDISFPTVLNEVSFQNNFHLTGFIKSLIQPPSFS